MKLTIVGCSGSYPGPQSPASCYLVEHEAQGRTWRILLDLGNGALGALHNYADPLAVDAVFLSHLHPDHCMDMCGYYVLRKYHPSGAQPRIPVWGPEGTAGRLARAYDLAETPGMDEEFDFIDHTAGPAQVGPFRVEAVQVNHPVPAFALRVSAGGRVLTYSGDTAWCDSLVTIARDADLFLCEASFRDGDANPPDVHLTGVEAGQVATEAGAARLMLTHIPPWYDAEAMAKEATRTFAGSVELATCAMTFEV